MNEIYSSIADEIGCKPQQVNAAVELLDQGATVPFISRYRKEVTGALDDSQLRQLESRLHYLRELGDRKAVVVASIEEQGKLTPELQKQINAADSKQRLEDLYLPFKPKRRTKGQMAIEVGLEPLANCLSDDPQRVPEQEAEAFVNPTGGVDSVKSALEGARYILMERFAEDPELAGKLREYLWREGLVKVTLVEGKEQEGAKFKDYFAYEENFITIPSHRALAILRGVKEGILTSSISVPGQPESRDQRHPCELMVADHLDIKSQNRPADSWLREVIRWTWRVKLLTRLEKDLFGRLREQAELEAIKVFASNLKDLLLTAPAGPKTTMGLDPGLRTGVKVAVVDATSKVIDHGTIYPHPPKNQWQASLGMLQKLSEQHRIELVAIGNGTGSRETDKLVTELIQKCPQLHLKKMVVNEAGASVYSASEFAALEFPDLDVTLRGAVSIARRLQDPLAELVKIEPKSIGVGQYQHDVAQHELARALDAVVEDCVNAVGVDVNTASSALLARVAGFSQSLAANLTRFRDEHGAFTQRQQLKKVSGLGAKTFEQAAGFLRVMQGDNPLDASAVHPEAYSLVSAIAEKYQRKVSAMIGDSGFLATLKPQEFVSERFGLPTIQDVIAELNKPGRDPRPEFRFASYKEGVEELKDLQPGMLLEGLVTNITNFGAFVDVGVHQDGLVHISALSHQFVKDPRDVVKTGDIVKVRVMEVDPQRKRIALSMRLDEDAKKERLKKDKAGNKAPAKIRPGRTDSVQSRRSNQASDAKNNQYSNKEKEGRPGSFGALLLAAEQKQEQKKKQHQQGKSKSS